MIAAPLSLVGAQGDDPDAVNEHPLMEMLALVPDIDAVRLAHPDELASFAPWVTFANYRASIETDPDFPYPANFADYAAQVEQGREKWWKSPLRNSFGPELPYLWDGTGEGRDPVSFRRAGPPVGEVMESLTGMDYFDIHVGMGFGRSPMSGLIFGGALDFEAIGAAHMARGYTENTVQGLRLWCSGKFGCEEPTTYDREAIEPYNVFDPEFGRQPAFFGLEGSSVNYIASAFDHDLLLTMVDATAEAHESLADAPDFRTLASALIDPDRYSGDLLQVHFISALVTDASSNPFEVFRAIDTSMNPREAWDAWVESVGWAQYGVLPAYPLMALADRQEGDDIVTIVALVYPAREDAEMAVPELVKRLTIYPGGWYREGFEPNEPLLSTRPGNPTVQDSYVYTCAETGWSAAVVTLRNDFAYTDDESGETISNHNVLYPIYLDDIMMQVDFYPLWTADFSEWIEWGN
jgi:hypothetical protein